MRLSKESFFEVVLSFFFSLSFLNMTEGMIGRMGGSGRRGRTMGMRGVTMSTACLRVGLACRGTRLVE